MIKAINKPTYLFFIITAVYLLVSFLTSNQMEEDAFIYFRLAEQLANGYGFVFNQGGPAIESGSGLTWLLILAALTYLPVSIIITSKLLGVLIGIGVLWLVWRLASCYVEERLALLAPLILSLCVPFYYWMQRGMETPLYVFLLVALFFIQETLIKKITSTQPMQLAFYSWSAVAWLTIISRPEGFLFAGLSAALLLCFFPKKSSFWRALLLLVLLSLVTEAVRIFVFNDFIPHAFYHKMTDSFAMGSKALLHYFYEGLAGFILLPLLFALTQKNFLQQYWRLTLFIFILTLWALKSQDWTVANRQAVPLITFLCLSVPLALDQFTRWRRWVVSVIFLLLVVMLIAGKEVRVPNGLNNNAFVTNLFSLNYNSWDTLSARLKMFSSPENYQEYNNEKPLSQTITYQTHATVGQFIYDNYPKNLTIVYDQVGQTAWYAGSDKAFIDNLGLTDRYIGHGMFFYTNEGGLLHSYGVIAKKLATYFWPDDNWQPSMGQMRDYVLNQKPELILIREASPAAKGPLFTLIKADERFKTGYKKVWLLNDFVTIYQRTDLPVRRLPVIPSSLMVKAL